MKYDPNGHERSNKALVAKLFIAQSFKCILILIEISMIGNELTNIS